MLEKEIKSEIIKATKEVLKKNNLYKTTKTMKNLGFDIDFLINAHIGDAINDLILELKAAS